MKKYALKNYSVLLLVIFLSLFTAFIISSCQNLDDGMGAVVIHLSRDARINAWKEGEEPDPRVIRALRYTVTLTGEGTISRNVSPGTSTLRMAVPPGLWEASITAYFDGIPFAIGYAEELIEIRAGQSTQVPIFMWRTDTTFFMVGSEEDLRDAFMAIGNGGAFVITITESFSTAVSFASSSNNVNLIIRGNNTISIANNTPGSLLTINLGQIVTLRDTNLVGYTGGSLAMSLVSVNGGDFIMEGSASISGNATELNGGGVSVGGGTFTMKGGTIGKNSANNGGGVYVGAAGTFIKTGGTIYGSGGNNGNYASGLGHAVFAAAGGSVFPNGGKRDATAGPGVNLSTTSTQNWDQ